MSGTIAAGTLRGLPPPRPDITAMYCLPSTLKLTGIALRRRAEPRLPEHLAGLHVVRAHVAIDVADEHEAAGRRKRRRQERRALLVLPHFLHRPHVVGGELAGLFLAVGRVLEQPIGARAAAAFGQRRLRAR